MADNGTDPEEIVALNEPELEDNHEAMNESSKESPSDTLLSVLSAMKDAMAANTVLLRDLHDYRGAGTGQSASEKAMSASDEANEAIEKADNETADALSLFGGSESEHSEDENNEAFLDEINASLNSVDDTCSPVSDKLAKLVNEKFSTEYTVEKRKEIAQKYKRPSNCEAYSYPRVNEEIWGSLPSHAKRGDIRMSTVQENLLSVTSAITLTVDELLKHREKKTVPNFKEMIPRLTDSVALLGQINLEISYKRRDVLKPHLSNDFKRACSRSRRPGKLLFGEDLAKTLQDIKTTNKIMSSSTKNRSERAKPYNRPYSSGQRRNYYQNNTFLRKEGRGSYPPRSNHSLNGKKKFTKN